MRYKVLTGDSPHPRGWTLPGLVVPWTRCGFPAPAGMDPLRGFGHDGHARIPRTRGDGPHAQAAYDAWRGDSPHPRGWTRGRERQPEADRGFPAPAGMDRSRTVCRLSCIRIPRTRGDGPSSNNCGYSNPMDSPHPRGWTLPGAAAEGSPAGFPAPAGMDPVDAAAQRGSRGIPRTRGDGTLAERGAQGDVDGFPAPAGMDPTTRPGPWTGTRIPRTRGDGPTWGVKNNSGGTDSPHPRGWTAAAGCGRPAEDGFPAPAGMDPRTGS